MDENNNYQNNDYQGGNSMDNNYPNGTYQNDNNMGNEYQGNGYPNGNPGYDNYQPYPQGYPAQQGYPVQQDYPVGLEEPMSVGEWMIIYLIMMIPCANIIMMFIWAFSKNEKKSKSNYFKASLIWMAVIFGIYFLFIMVVAVTAIVAGSR